MKIDSADENTEAIKLTEWEKEPTVRDLKLDYENARTAHQTQVGKIDGWLENLRVEGKAKPKTAKGNSQIQPKLIRKQAEWRYAALSEPFLSSPDIFDVSPVSWEDKEAAIQNQMLLNNQFNTKLNKVKFIDEYIRTGVDEGSVIVRCGWEFEEEEIEVEVPVLEFRPNPYLGEYYQKLSAMMQNSPDEYEGTILDHVKQGHQFSLERGIPYEAVIVGSELQTEMRTIKNHPTAEVCSYKNVTIDPSCEGDLSKAQFIVFSFPSSKSDLEKDGKYSNLEYINTEANSILGAPDHESDTDQTFNFDDEARKQFIVHEYWGYRDIDGSGLVKPIVAAWVGDTMIRLEDNPFPDQQHPFVIVPYLPVRGSVYGEPDGSLLEDNQKVIGAVTRGMIDIMAKSANGQTGIRKDMLDPVNRRRFERGQDYEFNQNVDPRQGIHMHTYAEIPQSAQFMLQMQNSEAEEMSGSRAFGATNTHGLGDTATVARGVLDAASKRELGILRRLADGIVQIGRKFIAMNSVFLEEEEVVRVTNSQFVPIRRDDLAGNFDLKLTISTAEEDNKKAEELSFMLQTMGNNMDFAMQQLLLSDIARLRKMPDLAKKIEEFEPQPDPIEQQRQQLEVQLLQAQVANEQAQIREREANALLDIAKASNLDSDTDLKNLDFVEQESGVKQERDLQKQGEQARANMALEAFKQQLSPQ